MTGATILTWPLHFIRVPQIFWCRDKHFGIGDRRPERDHVIPPVMPNRSIFLRIYNFTCMMTKQDLSPYLIEGHTVHLETDVPG